MGFTRRPEWSFLDTTSKASETAASEGASRPETSVKLTAKQAQLLMWKSIQGQDLEGLKQAIAAGANIDEEKKKNAPIIWAFEMGDLAMARIILQAKPKLTVTSASYQNLFGIAANQNSIPLAELLAEFDPKFASFRNIRVLPHNPLLTQWWLDKKLPLKFELDPGENAYWYGHREIEDEPLWMRIWSVIAFQHWNKGFLNQLASRLVEEEPTLQNKAEWQRCLIAQFMDVFKNKRLDILQTMAEFNWMPNLTPVNIQWMAGWTSKEHAPDTMVSLFWLAANAQHVEGMEFLLQSPEILNQATEEAQRLKERLYGILGVHVPTLEVVLKTGLPLFEVVDFTHVFQESSYRHKETPFETHGSGTFLHAKSVVMTKTLLEWTFKKNPEALWEVNGMGETILDVVKNQSHLGFDPSTLGEGFLKKHLKKNIDKATSKPKSMMKKRL